MKKHLIMLVSLTVLLGNAFAWPMPGNPGYECTTLGSGSEILCYYDDSQGSGCQIIVTNIVGTCTNCIATTPETCVNLKTAINDTIIQTQATLFQLKQDITDVWEGGYPSLKDLYEQGNAFIEPYVVGKGSAKGAYRVDGDITDPTLQQVQDSFGAAFGILPAGDKKIMSVDSSSQFSAGSYYGGIYNYYNTGIKPALENVKFNVDNALYKISPNVETLDALFTYVNVNLNCDACSASWDGGSSGGGSFPSGCPCEQQFDALRDLIQAIKYDVSDISLTSVRIQHLAENIRALLTDIGDNVSNINYSVSRLDDYVTDDLSNSIWRIECAISNLVSSVSSNNENYISRSYSNAVERVPDLAWHEKLTSTGSFDFVQYSARSNWFSRVEYLLMRVAGVFDPPVDTNAEYTAAENTLINSVEEEPWQFGELKEKVGDTLSYVSARKNFFKPFSGVFARTDADLPSKIVILPDVSLHGSSDGVVGPDGSVGGGGVSVPLLSTFPEVSLDLRESGNGSYSLQDFFRLSNAIFTWIWTLLGFILICGMVYVYVRVVLTSLAWYHKITRAWASNLIDDKGFR